MRLRDILSYAFYALKERKVRTTLTVLGIVIGPAAIVALTATTRGFSIQIEDQLFKLGTNTILVSPVPPAKLDFRHVNEISTLEGVKSVYPFYIISGRMSASGEAVTIFAVDLTEGLKEAVPGMEVKEGQLPDPLDYVGAAVGYYIANPQDPQKRKYSVGDVITLELKSVNRPQGFTKSFVIRAILKEFGPTFFVNPDSSLFIPLDAGRIIVETPYYTGLLVIAENQDLVDSVVNAIKEKYGKDVEVYSVKVAINIARNILGSVNMILISVASISVLVAFIGIMTTMFTSTIERTREIGILKALGFSSRDVMSLFLAESTLMGLIGGLIGASFGIALAYVFSFFSSLILAPNARGPHLSATVQIQPAFSPEMFLSAIAMATAVGALAGLIPAWRASKLTPVEALRYE